VTGQLAGRDGDYVGTADPYVTDGGLCIRTQPVGDFHVRGDEVRFGRFDGRIERGDNLQMVYDGGWLVGQFQGGTFHGQLMTYTKPGTPACSFMVSLRRVAG
jgi:hypothetical protein